MACKEFWNSLPYVLLRRIRHKFLCIGLAFSFFAIYSPIQADTTITETTGAGDLGTQVLLPTGNVFGIRGGQTVGTSLFHSFGEFSIATGNIAQFQTSTQSPDAGMSNILARVTGANPSAIFGTIDSATYYPNANFFLINPNGILFGPNATLDIGGMAHFTTADYLKLANTVQSEANPGAQDALLSTFPVAAFGFLPNPANITVQGSQLVLANGTGLSLVGGNQGFDYINPDTGDTAFVPNGMTMTGGNISAPGGQINIVSVAAAGIVSAVDFLPTPGMTMGNITLTQGTILDVSGDGSETVRIRGGQFVMDQSALIANTTGANDGAPTAISVNVTNGVSLNIQSSLVARATAAGRGGDIELTGRTIDIAGTSFVSTTSSDSGSPGNITATASESISVRNTDEFGNPSAIFSDSFGLASTGSITLRSPLIILSEGAVETRMFGFGSEARAGDITVEATHLNLINGGMIRTTSGSDIAPSGNISITAGEVVALAGASEFGQISNITNENFAGGTGNISIQTGSLALSDQARINSQTLFDADPAAANQAKISITADSTIALSTGSRIDVGGFFSDTGRLDLSANSITMSSTSAITTLSNASGAAGPILMTVQDMTISGGSQIVSSSAQGFGRGGDITINSTGSVLVTGQGTDPLGDLVTSGIFSNTMAGFEDPSFTGDAGNISITGHSIEVSNGAHIDSSSQLFALGNAGNIDLQAPTITVNGGTLSTSTEFSGHAGTITLGSDTVMLSNNGHITSSSIGPGNAGSIDISAGNLFSMTNSSVTTEATQSGGGAIKITTNPNGTVQLFNSLISASVLNGTGGGGSVNIDPQSVILVNSQILANAIHGAGGNIFITTNLLLFDGNSEISASSQFGQNGTVTIQSPNAPISGQIHPLGKTPLLATSLLNQQCASVANGQFSSFTVAGRNSVPTEPGGWLASPLSAGDMEPRLKAQGRRLDDKSVSTGPVATAQQREDSRQMLSLRQIAPVGFLTQTFAVDRSAGCRS